MNKRVKLKGHCNKLENIYQTILLSKEINLELINNY